MKRGRISTAAITALSALMMLHTQPANAGNAPTAEQIIEQARFYASTNRLIVKLRRGPTGLAQPMSGERMNTLMTRAGQSLRVLRRGAQGTHVLQLGATVPNSEAKALARKLAQDPAVEYAQPDFRMRALATIPNDPLFTDQWYLSDDVVGLNLPLAWDRTVGNSVVVAVLDTGIVPHGDIDPARVLPGYDFISPDTVTGGTTLVAGDGDGRDANPTDPGDRITVFDQTALNNIFGSGSCPIEESSWHGTQVASVIAATTNNGATSVGIGNSANMAGINWNALILPMRVLGRCGGFTSDIMEAMRWAAGLHVDGVPDNPQANRAQVLNLSLGVSSEPCTGFERAVFEEVLATGVVKAIVTAAGNDGAAAVNASPGSCPGAINVAGVLRNGNKASLSNFGDAVTVAAPYGTSSPDGQTGANSAIYSLGNDGADSFVAPPAGDIAFLVGGTSFSAPLVSGVVSLMLSVNSNLTASQVYDVLRQSARSFPGSSNCNSLGCGAGKVDALAAIQQAENSPPAPREFPDANDGGGGCSTARGSADWSLVMLLLVACGYVWRRAR